MTCVKRTRIRQIVLKKEDVENTPETLVAADVLALGIFDPSLTYEVPQFDRTPAAPTLSKLTSVSGTKLGTATFDTDIKGSGAVNTRPPVGELLEACGFREHRRHVITVNTVVGTPVYGRVYTGGTSGARLIFLKQNTATAFAIAPLDATAFTDTETFTDGQGNTFNIDGAGQPGTQAGFAYVPLSTTSRVAPIGAITGGPFVSGEAFTAAPSGATGIINATYATGVTNIYYSLDSGSANVASGDTITGSISGATATTSAAGSCALPTQAVTLESREDGIVKRIKGARGKVTFNFNAVGEPARGAYEIQGSSAIDPFDGPLFPNPDDPVNPPKFLGVTLTFGTYTPRLSSMSIVVDNTLSPRLDATDNSGIIGVLISDRAFTGSTDPEMEIVTTENFHGDWFNDVVKNFNLVLGSVAGNIVEFFAPRMQYTSIGDDDRDGIALAGTEFQFVQGPNGGDDDFLIMFY